MGKRSIYSAGKETLLEATERLMRDCPRHLTLAQIAEETGIGASWLSEFNRNKIPDPGIRKVQSLFDYLSIDRPAPAGKWAWDEALSYLDLKAKGRRDCVYTIYSNDEKIYIGTTDSVRTRFQSHCKSTDVINSNPTHFEVIYCSNAVELERHLITIYRPKLNKVNFEKPKAKA